MMSTMKQTKKQSLLESITNTFVGFIISLISVIFILDKPFFENLLITLYFTIISIIRGYIIRRYFNRNKQN